MWIVNEGDSVVFLVVFDGGGGGGGGGDGGGDGGDGGDDDCDWGDPVLNNQIYSALNVPIVS